MDAVGSIRRHAKWVMRSELLSLAQGDERWVFQAEETARGSGDHVILHAVRSSQNWCVDGRTEPRRESRRAGSVQIKRLLYAGQQTDFVRSSLGDIYGFQDLYFESYSGYRV